MKKIVSLLILSLMSVFAFATEDSGRTYTIVDVISPPSGKKTMVLKSDTTNGTDKISIVQVVSADCKTKQVEVELREYFFNDKQVETIDGNETLGKYKEDFYYSMLCKK